MYLKDELSGFVPAAQATDIIKAVTRGSSILRMSKIEQMTSETKKFNVMTDGTGAYWVGEGERIKTSKATWIHPVITAKKLAVIIPITREKLNDSAINVFSELKDSIAEAFYTAIDSACLFGTSSPFATNIMKSITESGNIVTDNANVDIAMSDAMAMVEEGGHDPNGFIGRIGVKNLLRKLRDSNGAPAYINGTNGGSELYGNAIEFVRNGAWDNTAADVITGEWKYSIVGIREGISYEILKEATLQGTLDSDGSPLSLAEQDMVAIKATMRLGYLVVKDDAFAAYKNAAPTLGTLTVQSTAGEAGKSVISVNEKVIGGYRLVYKTAASTAPTVTYDADLSSWTELNSGDEITATNGHKLTVALVTSDGKARKSGTTDVVSGL